MTNKNGKMKETDAGICLSVQEWGIRNNLRLFGIAIEGQKAKAYFTDTQAERRS